MMIMITIIIIIIMVIIIIIIVIIIIIIKHQLFFLHKTRTLNVQHPLWADVRLCHNRTV